MEHFFFGKIKYSFKVTPELAIEALRKCTLPQCRDKSYFHFLPKEAPEWEQTSQNYKVVECCSIGAIALHYDCSTHKVEQDLGKRLTKFILKLNDTSDLNFNQIADKLKQKVSI